MQSTAAKVLAVILTVLLTTAALAGLFCSMMLEQYNVYTRSYQDARNSALAQIIDDRTWRAGNELLFNNTSADEISLGDGFAFCVYDKDKNLVFDGRNGRAVSLETELMHFKDSYVRGYLLSDIPESDYTLNTAAKLFDSFYPYRYSIPAGCAVCTVLALLLFTFLMAAAGHRPDGTIRGSFLQRIPFDLLSFAACIGVICCAALFIETLEWYGEVRHILSRAVLGCSSFMAAGFLTLTWCMVFSVHIKTRDTLKSCLSIRILFWLRTVWNRLRSVIFLGLSKLPSLWRYVVLLCTVSFADLVCSCIFFNREMDTAFFFWFVRSCIFIPFCLYCILCFRRIRSGTRAIAEGRERADIDTKHLRWIFLDEANDLNNIRRGINLAVEERMRSERFKTELITNVSHDIKTPLTSIINYADLLSKEEPESEKMRGYIEVISRQSLKLKKLIEDLTEASKASSGVLPVSLTLTDVGVLLEQTQGEYAEKMENSGLEFIVSPPGAPLNIQADARHIWRVFDNLMNNIVKYSRTGTRVYLCAEEKDGKAMITFRNISDAMLNIPPERLMERFVRGDDSRHTNGSGLGLSIANSLTELQGGTMNITIDGDLFKVTLSFNTTDETK